jgi:hypothetical protein
MNELYYAIRRCQVPATQPEECETEEVNIKITFAVAFALGVVGIYLIWRQSGTKKKYSLAHCRTVIPLIVPASSYKIEGNVNPRAKSAMAVNFRSAPKQAVTRVKPKTKERVRWWHGLPAAPLSSDFGLLSDFGLRPSDFRPERYSLPLAVLAFGSLCANPRPSAA